MDSFPQYPSCPTTSDLRRMVWHYAMSPCYSQIHVDWSGRMSPILYFDDWAHSICVRILAIISWNLQYYNYLWHTLIWFNYGSCSLAFAQGLFKRVSEMLDHVCNHHRSWSWYPCVTMYKHIRIFYLISYKIGTLIKVSIQIKIFCIFSHDPLNINYSFYQSFHCGIVVYLTRIDYSHYSTNTMFSQIFGIVGCVDVAQVQLPISVILVQVHNQIHGTP